MGCTSSKESAPRKSKRDKLYGSDTNLPTDRYLSDPAPKHVTFENPSNNGKPRAGEPARPKETFEDYARRGVIRQSALNPVESKKTAHLSHKKRVGGYEKYTQE